MNQGKVLVCVSFAFVSIVPWSSSHITSSNDDGIAWNNTIVPALAPNASDTLATHGALNANANPTMKMLPPFVQTLLNQVQGQQQGGGQRQLPSVPGTVGNMASGYGNMMSQFTSGKIPYLPGFPGYASWNRK